MSDDPSAAESSLLERALAAEPELAEELRPLLDGAFGHAARRLVRRCLAERLRTSTGAREALRPALADALRGASSDRHDTL
jgi:hypothetical protein